jgi:hypothetical protein
MTSDVLPGSEQPGGSAQARYEEMASRRRSTPAMRRARMMCFTFGALFMLTDASTGDALAFPDGRLCRRAVLLVVSSRHNDDCSGRG